MLFSKPIKAKIAEKSFVPICSRSNRFLTRPYGKLKEEMQCFLFKRVITLNQGSALQTLA